MKIPDFPSPSAFRAIRSASVTELSKLSEKEVRPLLPCLVRMALCSPVDASSKWTESRKVVQRLLSGIEAVNSIVALLSVDFSLLEQDALKEQQLRRKAGGGANAPSVLVESLENGMALEFERSEPSRQLRLILSEMLRIVSQLPTKDEFVPEKCEIFECELYLEEVSDVICIAQAELPSLLPLDQVALALLRVKYGPWLLCRLVVNAPDSFEQVFSALLESGEVQDENCLGGMVRTQALRHLCTMNPSCALAMRAEAVGLCRLPGLAVALTLDFGVDCRDSPIGTSDLVAFLSGLLLGGDIRVKNWFAEFLRTGQKSATSIMISLRNQLLKEVMSLVPSTVKQHLVQNQTSSGELTKDLTVSESEQQDLTGEAHQDKETLEILQAMEVHTDYEVIEECQTTGQMKIETFEISEEDVVRASALLRLYCALKGLAGMKLSQEEADELLCLVTCHPQASAAGARCLVLGLCTLLACPYIVSTPEREQMAVRWIRWLSKEDSHYEAAGAGTHASFGEILLLIAIHFHGNNLEAITELVCSLLGMKIRLSSVSRIKMIFTQELFPEKVVTAHAITVPVSLQLSSLDVGFLPIHCVHQLLRARAFTRHAVEVKEWVYKQLHACIMPLHHLVTGLLEAFVNSVINPISSSKSKSRSASPTLCGFTEAEVMLVFKDQEQSFKKRGSSAVDITPQLLMLYYVLLYHDCLLTSMKTSANSNIQPMWLTAALWAQLPIKQLVHQACSAQDQLHGLYPSLLRLLATHYPHLCLVDDWLAEEEQIHCQQHVSSPVAISCSPQKVQQGITLSAQHIWRNLPALPCFSALSIAKENPCAAMLLLGRLVKAECSGLIPYQDVLVECLPGLLVEGIPRRVLTLYCNLWARLNTIIPRKLWLASVNILCHVEDMGGHLAPQPYTDEDLMKDPLTVLRCHRSVFRCPPVFDIVLRILTAYLAASRALLSQHLQAHPAPKSSISSGVEQEREELRSALVAAQESAAVQILLEVCMPTKEEQYQESGVNKCVLREIQCRVCSLLHQMFISNPNLVKLVHFQGYPAQLLPVTVAGIPSIHICLDFVQELLNQPPLKKQLFAIHLGSYLALQYPLPKAMAVTRYIFSRLASLLAALPANKRAPFFIPVLPSLVRFCRAFPPLSEEAAAFLVQLGKVASSCATTSASRIIDLPSGSLLQQLTRDRAEQEDPGFVDDSVKPNEAEESSLEYSAPVSKASPDCTDIRLCQAVKETFTDLLRTVLQKHEAAAC